MPVEPTGTAAALVAPDGPGRGDTPPWVVAGPVVAEATLGLLGKPNPPALVLALTGIDTQIRSVRTTQPATAVDAFSPVDARRVQ
jgi:hypothetical protein